MLDILPVVLVFEDAYGRGSLTPFPPHFVGILARRRRLMLSSHNDDQRKRVTDPSSGQACIAVGL